MPHVKLSSEKRAEKAGKEEDKVDKKANVQDYFLNAVRADHTPVTLFLMNGVKLCGVVKGFDSFVVALRVGDSQQIVYKHAISTMIPAREVEFNP